MMIITNDPDMESSEIFIQKAKIADMIGDFPHLVFNKNCTSSAVCLDEGDVLLLSKNKLLEFV